MIMSAVCEHYQMLTKFLLPENERFNLKTGMHCLKTMQFFRSLVRNSQGKSHADVCVHTTTNRKQILSQVLVLFCSVLPYSHRRYRNLTCQDGNHIAKARCSSENSIPLWLQLSNSRSGPKCPQAGGFSLGLLCPQEVVWSGGSCTVFLQWNLEETELPYPPSPEESPRGEKPFSALCSQVLSFLRSLFS